MDEEKLSEMFHGLLILHQLIQKNIFNNNTIEKETKMSFTLYSILSTLKSTKMLPISKTGNLMCIKKQNMTYLTDKLVENGLVKRVPDMSDRRVINIIITNKGEKYVDEWQKNRIRGMLENFTCFENEDLKKLHKSVDNMMCILSKMDNYQNK